MTYLTRLAAQTGLIAPQMAESPPPPPGLEVIDQEVIVTTPDAPRPPDTPAVPVPDVTPPPQIVTEVIQSDVPAPSVPDAGPPVETTEVAFVPALPPAPPEPDPVPIAAEAPPEDASPEQMRSWQLRQVMAWVATNDGKAAPPPSATDSPAATARPPPVAPADPAPPEIPSLEIAQTREAEPPAPIAAPATQAPPPPPPIDAPPSQSQAPAPQPRAPQSQVVEETVQISIGAIRLNVTPPPRATAAPTLAPAPAAPAAPSPPPSTASRLARRYIRI